MEIATMPVVRMLIPPFGLAANDGTGSPEASTIGSAGGEDANLDCGECGPRACFSFGLVAILNADTMTPVFAEVSVLRLQLLKIFDVSIAVESLCCPRFSFHLWKNDLLSLHTVFNFTLAFFPTREKLQHFVVIGSAC